MPLSVGPGNFDIDSKNVFNENVILLHVYESCHIRVLPMNGELS